MSRLLWDNILRGYLASMTKAVPILGWPVINNVFLYLIENYLIDPLFNELSRYGVFTSIDWKNTEQYAAYRQEAVKLIGAQNGEWPDREKFKNAARNLIRFDVE